MRDKICDLIRAFLIFALGTALLAMSLGAAAEFNYATRDYTTLDAVGVFGDAPARSTAKPPGSVAEHNGRLESPSHIAQ
jgi:uncharacterized membrane protein YbhN (UPF0104 family)